MDDVKAKQQIVEKIKNSTSILVTVSNDPSVDALSAALGLTLLLDKLEKHPTAIFSGAVPPAIEFLEPEKTFDSTTDSLRDFIIALDKSKADHLKYKVEGDSVKIFITPYRTTITSDDLEFSQGDYNVELVIALGVDNQDHLDAALDTHGQILHDAAIITVTAGDQTSKLGGIDWHDPQASSMSEMVAGLAEALKTDKTKTLIDGQIATALLTGIVAETERFSNTHTTSRVMTVAAQLMSAGADQQLIASKLQEATATPEPISVPVIDADAPAQEEKDETPEDKDVIRIDHKPNETLEELDKRVKAAEQAQAAEKAESAYEAVADVKVSPSDTPAVSSAYGIDTDDVTEPTLGGVLNATTEQAAEDARREIENDQNKTILNHSYASPVDTSSPYLPPSEVSGHEFIGSAPAPGSTSVNTEMPPATGDLVHSAYAVDDPEVAPTPATPPAPADLGLPMPPALPDFSQLPPAPAAPILPTPGTGPQPERLGDILAEPSAPVTPAPEVSPSLPPMPGPAAPSDPAQFKIPGQP